jgi:hypothetical protein
MAMLTNISFSKDIINSRLQIVSGDAVHQPTWPLLLKIEHTMYGKIAGFWVIISKTIKLLITSILLLSFQAYSIENLYGSYPETRGIEVKIKGKDGKPAKQDYQLK